MSKSLLTVYSNCPEGQEQAFNEWYDTIHVPDILSVEGFTAARRYQLAGPGPKVNTRNGEAVANYLAMYEIEDEDPRSAMERLGKAVAGFAERGRMYAGLQLVASATYVALGEQQRASA